eukprot:4660576-Pyramimonas_sp.AAC.1
MRSCFAVVMRVVACVWWECFAVAMRPIVLPRVWAALGRGLDCCVLTRSTCIAPVLPCSITAAAQ